MTDPRIKHAEQLREVVVEMLESRGSNFRQILREVRRRAVGRDLSHRQLDAALQALRRAGRIRFRRPFWEVVP